MGRKKTGTIEICPTCNKGFYVYPCQVGKVKYCSAKCRYKGKPPWDKGIPRAQETKDKIRDTLTGRKLPEEHCRNISNGLSGIPHHWTNKGMLGKHPSEETKEKLRLVRIGTHVSEETRGKMSASLRALWENPTQEFIDRYVESHNRKPTKPEISVDIILDNISPGRFQYVGDGKVWIGGRNPDFIDKTGGRIIEVFGIYYHYKRKDLRITATEEWRIEHFAKHGYRTLVIWDTELSDPDTVVEKIRRFLEPQASLDIPFAKELTVTGV